MLLLLRARRQAEVGVVDLVLGRVLRIGTQLAGVPAYAVDAALAEGLDQLGRDFGVVQANAFADRRSQHDDGCMLDCLDFDLHELDLVHVNLLELVVA